MLQGKSSQHVVCRGILAFAQSLMLPDVLDAVQSNSVEPSIENSGLDL